MMPQPRARPAPDTPAAAASGMVRAMRRVVSVSHRCGVVLCAALIAGCASGPKSPLPGRDGPAAEVPADLGRTPDAEPRVEPIRAGGPNKPYEVLGQSYTPQTRDLPMREKGLASWYGRKFHGRKTASGEIYDMHAMTAAHKTMPLPSYARVRNPANGREIIVRVNDRGPFVAGRIIDLSYTAALKLDLLRGVAPVEVERLTFEEIRSGAWRRDAPLPSRPEPAPAEVATAPPAASLPPPPPPPSPSPLPLPLPLPLPAAEPVDGAPPPARGYWLQLGAFRERAGATDFQQRVAVELDWLAPLMAVFSEAPLFRLQAGPYATRDEAQGAAQRVRDALQLVPLVIERR